MIEVDATKVLRFALGMAFSIIGLYVALWRSRIFERLPDGSMHVHYDHAVLNAGLVVAGFGAVIWGAPYLRETLRLLRAFLGGRSYRLSRGVRRVRDEDEE